MKRNILTFTSPKQILYFPSTFSATPHTLSECKWIFVSPSCFFSFLKISTSAGYMGCLVHIGFFIISPYPRYSAPSLRLLQQAGYLPPCMQTTRSHFARYQHSETEIDKILNTWKSAAFVATYLRGGGGGEANRLFRSFFSHISFFIPSISTVNFRHFTDGDFVFKFHSNHPNS